MEALTRRLLFGARDATEPGGTTGVLRIKTGLWSVEHLEIINFRGIVDIEGFICNLTHLTLVYLP